MKKLLIIFLIIISSVCLVSCSNSKDQVKMIDINLTDEEYTFAVKKGNTELVEQFNTFLREIKSNGELDIILNKYFGGDGELQGYPITTEAVQNTDELFVVATNCPFEPFEYIGDDGLAYGIDMEIAGLFAKAHNLELVIKNMDFNAILTNVDAGYSDIGMAAITITEDRKANYDFTNTYYQASQKLIVAESNTYFDDCKTKEDVENKLKALNNEKIGYQLGTTGNWYVAGDDSDFEGFKNVENVGYSTSQLAINDVKNGQLFGVVVDEAPGAVMVEAINGIKDFNKLWTIFTNALSQKTYQDLILKGLYNTLMIAVFGLLIGIVIGTFIAIIKVRPKHSIFIKAVDKICTIYVGIFRGTPMVVQLLIAYYVLLPILGIIGANPLQVGIWVFGLNSGAYVSEIMRGGFNSVDKGQLEAGRGIGLGYTAAMTKIVIPQAIKNTLPTLGNEFITLIKETSVVSFITVVDLYTAFNTIGTNKYSVILPYLFMALIYIVLVGLITILVKLLERGINNGNRNQKSL